jgi:hypothetical protein
MVLREFHSNVAAEIVIAVKFSDAIALPFAPSTLTSKALLAINVCTCSESPFEIVRVMRCAGIADGSVITHRHRGSEWASRPQGGASHISSHTGHARNGKPNMHALRSPAS